MVLSKEKSQNIDGEYIFTKAYEISDDYNLMYKDYRIHIFLKLSRYENGLWLIPACSLLSVISEK
jgi:hypothetical protein